MGEILLTHGKSPSFENEEGGHKAKSLDNYTVIVMLLFMRSGAFRFEPACFDFFLANPTPLFTTIARSVYPHI